MAEIERAEILGDVIGKRRNYEGESLVGSER